MKRNKNARALIPLLLASPYSQNAASDTELTKEEPIDLYLDRYTVGTINMKLPTYLAGHRSHSSHRSHRSSSSGSSSSTRSAPKRTAPTSTPLYAPSKPMQSDPLGQPSRPLMSIPSSEPSKLDSLMKDREKRANLILRLQLTLEALDFYDGKLDGVMGAGTRKALNKYRISVRIPVSETIDVQTLNSLGILVR